MMREDFGHAARVLRNNPMFAAAAVATIALGIGSGTAVFSVANAVLLRPLPYKNPDRLLLVSEASAGRVELSFFDSDYFDLRSGAKSAFDDFAAVNGYLGILPKEDGMPDQVRFANVTTNFFRLMGAHIAFGRDFVSADGQPQPPRQPDDPGYDPHLPMRNPEARRLRRLPTMAILSYEFWRRRFGGNTAIVGRALGNAEVVGVLAPHFEVLLPPALGVDRAPDVYSAARLPHDRRGSLLRVIGRMKAGITPERAASEIQAVAEQLRKKHRLDRGFDIRIESLHKRLIAQVRPALREREFAVRAALGGTWRKLAGQVLAEALLLSGLGTLAGGALAWTGIRGLIAIAPPGSLPRLYSVAFDWRVLVFAAAAGLIAAVVFGAVPAWRTARPDLIQVLRGGTHLAGPGPSLLPRDCVVVAEVALSFVLLIGSGLMFRSFLALQRIDPGYDPRGLLTFRLQSSRLILSDSTPQQRAVLMRHIETALQAIPGVQSVTASTLLPLASTFIAGPWGLNEAQLSTGPFSTGRHTTRLA